jgi:hypothetical protein
LTDTVPVLVCFGQIDVNNVIYLQNKRWGLLVLYQIMNL